MVVVIREGIGADVGPDEINFPVFYPGIAVLQVGLAYPEGFDLRALQDDSCLECFGNFVVMPCLFILANNLYSGLCLLVHDKKSYHGQGEKQIVLSLQIDKF